MNIYGTNANLKDLLAIKQAAIKMQHQYKSKFNQNGLIPSSLRGRGMEFADLRSYQAGDEIRHMAWRMTAKTGKPIIKLYNEERERPIFLIVDFNPSMFFGTRKAFKSVIAAHLAALIVWCALKNKDKIGGLLFSATNVSLFPLRQKESMVLPLLKSLSAFSQFENQQKPQSLSHILTKAVKAIRPGTVVVLISDFYQLDDKSMQQMGMLKKHSDVLAYHVYDTLEQNFPLNINDLVISDGSENFCLDFNNKSIQQSYRDFWLQRKQNLAFIFNKLQIPYNCIHSSSDLLAAVRTIFIN